MGLQFDLSLENRSEDRVFVSVLLGPNGTPEPTEIDGVAVMLVGKAGERLSNRLLLPIAGQLQAPMVSTIELRATSDDVPKGARIVGVAWKGCTQWEASCPADPGTHLEAHMRGRHKHSRGEVGALETLSCGERARLAAIFPWLEECEPKPPTVLEPEEPEEDPEEFRHFCHDLGLDDDDTDWLQELLAED